MLSSLCSCGLVVINVIKHHPNLEAFESTVLQWSRGEQHNVVSATCVHRTRPYTLTNRGELMFVPHEIRPSRDVVPSALGDREDESAGEMINVRPVVNSHTVIKPSLQSKP